MVSLSRWVGIPSRGTLNQPFGDLHGVGGRAFANLVSADEKIDPAPVLAADVLANSSDQNIVLPAGFQRHGEMILLRIIHDPHAWRGRKNLPHLLWRNRPLEFEIDAFAVCPRNRHAHTRRGNNDSG